MYGIVNINGHQYKVVPGQTLDVEKFKNANAGETINLPQVLMVSGDETIIGAPFIKDAKIVAKVVRHDKSRKILVLKRRPGKYVKKNGHRQSFTTLFIAEIHNGKGGVLKAQETKKVRAVKAKKEPKVVAKPAKKQTKTK